MPTNTYVALDTTTVVTATPSVTFSNISQAYTDLVVVMTGTIASGGAGAASFQFNGDTSSTNYSNIRVYGDGTNAASTKNSNQPRVVVAFFSDSLPSTNIVSIMNYANSTTYKTCVYRNNASDNRAQAGVGLWRSTSAINEILITNSAGLNFTVGTTFSLYGIKSWSDEVSPKATGGYVYEDSSYWYHAFPFSSTFTPSESITADILVVAGGGSGGSAGDRGAGGGGAGGLLYHASQSLTMQNYTVTVGAGGAGNNYVGYPKGNNGTNSIFGALTASVGGGGGGSEPTANQAGLNGGSGGGGGANADSVGNGGTESTSGGAQGYPGGNGYGPATSGASGGGGGGAGAAGANASLETPTAGGVGKSTYSSWGSATGTGQNSGGTYYYAGGGGGAGGGNNASRAASGGLGGGGAAKATSGGSATSGTANTGGGGGAHSYNGVSGAGGSGVVIVRYAK